jgi:hypothetical protein
MIILKLAYSGANYEYGGVGEMVLALAQSSVACRLAARCAGKYFNLVLLSNSCDNNNGHCLVLHRRVGRSFETAALGRR